MAAVPAAEGPAAALIDIPYELLQDPNADLSSYIEQGFGPDGLGALTISGIPGYVEMRQRLLPLAQQLAVLPEEVKASYEHPSSNYNFGWSHGKESLKPGVPDTAKGSFYANPLQDTPRDIDPDTAAQYPSYYSSNIWPTDEVPELEGAFKQLGQLIVEVGVQLMRHCDRFLNAQQQQQQEQGQGQEAAEAYLAALSLSPRSSPAGTQRSAAALSPSSPSSSPSNNRGGSSSNLADMLDGSQCHKARLLHYFPPPGSAGSKEEQEGVTSDTGYDTGDRGDQQGSSDAWCGWHLDHGTLTGLTCAMYLDAAGRPVPSPDPAAGLYIRTRSGQVVRAPIPPTSCAFQLGQVASIQSGGRLRATPHCVRAPAPGAAQGVCRNTFAVFMQPNVAQRLVAPPLPPPLAALLQQDSGEWQAGMSFGAFAEKTMKQYYGGGAGAAAGAPSAPRRVLVVHE